MNVQVGYITHDEAMINNFINDPEYADYLLSEVIKDGDAEEIALVQNWYDEAKARTLNVPVFEAVIV